MSEKRKKIFVELNKEDKEKFKKVKADFYTSYDSEVFKILLRKYKLEERS